MYLTADVKLTMTVVCRAILDLVSSDHRLSVNRPTKRGKEKSPSNGLSMTIRD
jgi:hypothetical protein